jgi:hypothetical protein
MPAKSCAGAEASTNGGVGADGMHGVEAVYNTMLKMSMQVQKRSALMGPSPILPTAATESQ